MATETDDARGDRERAGEERGTDSLTRRRGGFLLSAAAAIGVLVVALAMWVLWPRGTTELTTDDALADYRASRAGAETPDTGSDDGASTDDLARWRFASNPTPEPGVYEYRASGSQRVKLGPLPAEDRTLPDTVTVVIGEPTDGARGTRCFEWTLNLFREHTEETTWCIDGDGALTLDAHTKHQRVGALSPTATLVCDPNLLIEAGSGTTQSDCTLSLSGGPASIQADLRGTATVGTTEEHTVSADDFATTPLTLSHEVSGALKGTLNESYLLSEDLLPLRSERNLELSGPATLSERATLELVRAQPVR